MESLAVTWARVRQRALRAQGVVAQATGVPQNQLCAPARGGTKAAFARQMAMYLCHAVYRMTLHQVACAFGRDPTTVARAIRIVERQRADPDLDRTLRWLEAMLRRDGRLA
ncbi:MAG: chromosomal replication initiator DnaA [Alphaproteobacteria bacterium]|nr:chromosomal replication initiator DnaA [Alphaproteobacteria bacterium]